MFAMTGVRVVALALIGSILASAAPAPQPNTVDTAKRQSPSLTSRMGARAASKRKAAVEPKDFSTFLCPVGSYACPAVDDLSAVTPESAATLTASLTSLADWMTTGFECVEFDTELSQCGGCLSLGAGYVVAQWMVADWSDKTARPSPMPERRVANVVPALSTPASTAGAYRAMARRACGHEVLASLAIRRDNKHTEVIP